MHGEEGRSNHIAVLQATLHKSRVARLHASDDHLGNEAVTPVVIDGGETLIGDDGFLGRDTQHHNAFEGPHDKLPAVGHGAVEASV